MHETGDVPKSLGNTERPMDKFLFTSQDKPVSSVIVKHFEGDSNAELVKSQLRSRGYNVEEKIVGGS